MSFKSDSISKGLEIYKELGLELTQGMCEPVKTEEEVVDDAAELSGATQSVIDKDNTVAFVSKETAPDMVAPHTGAQANAAAGVGLVGLSVMIALTVILFKK